MADMGNCESIKRTVHDLRQILDVSCSNMLVDCTLLDYWIVKGVTICLQSWYVKCVRVLLLE